MKITLNKELNGIELFFEAKPDAKTLEAVKNNGFRWSPSKKIWYAKQTSDRLTFIETLGTITESSSNNIINLDNLGVKPEGFSYYGADLAKLIREDLKKRGVKGVTVRARKITYDTGITITVKATAEDFSSIEEASKRYGYYKFLNDIANHELYIEGRYISNADDHMTEEEKQAAYELYIEEQIKKLNSVQFGYSWADRKYYFEFTSKFWEKLTAIYKIANQWNYCNDDIMTDYFDRGYYLDIDIKKPDNFAVRDFMTEEERQEYAEEIRREEEEKAAQLKALEEEQKKAQEETEKYNKYVAESEEIIYNDITIEDLNESEQLFAYDLSGGLGKESTLEELNESINENNHKNNALITRKVIFKSQEAFERFNNLFLHDFVFLAGFGGTASEDVRLEGLDYFNLNEEQRNTIELYSNNCVAIYLNDSLKLVIDPQGYNYARYVYLVDNCTILEAKKELEKQRTESEEKDPFYMPAPVEEQIKNINIGDQITVWQCDGWLLNKVLDGVGMVADIRAGSYAQYKGFYIDLIAGNKQKSVFLRDSHTCLIYEGLDCLLPEEVTKERINDHMSRLYNYDELIPNIYRYFKSKGIEPILNTWQH